MGAMGATGWNFPQAGFVQFHQAALLDVELSFDLDHIAVWRAYERGIALSIESMARVFENDGRKIQHIRRHH